MRKIFTILVLWLAAQYSWGQHYAILNAGTGNPGGLNTDPEQPAGILAPLGWTAITPGTTPNPTWSSIVNLPFTFSFNGNSYNSFKVSTTGVLTFTTSAATAPAATAGVLPRADVPDNSVLVGPLTCPGANDQILTKTFGTSPNRQQWVNFASVSQPAAVASAFIYWAIVLEESTNRIYVVDQRSTNNNNPPTPTPGLTIGLQYSATSAINMPGSPNIVSQAQTFVADDASDNVYHAFFPGTRPTQQISFGEVRNSQYIVGTNPVFFRGSFRNFGSAAINSFVLTYTIDGTTASDTFRGRTIAPLSSDTFIFTTGWTPRSEGVFPLKIKASFVNGNNVTDASHDSASKNFEVFFRTVPRVSLHEGFTSSTCPPCVQGNIVLSAVLAAKPKSSYSVIKYQQDYPAPGNDPNFTAESGTRHDYYQITGIPYLAVNGIRFNDNTSGYDPDLFDEYRNIPSVVDVKGSYKVVGRTVNATLTYKSLRDFTSPNIAAHIVIAEKTVRHSSATNGETEFKHVMRKMITGPQGQLITGGLQKDSTRSISVSYTFPNPNSGTPINFDSLEVIVFLQDRTTKEVFNSANAEIERDPVAVKVGRITDPASIIALTAAPYTLKGIVSNNGLDTVRSFYLNYRIDNGATLTDTISGVSIPTLGTYNFTHTKLWTPTVAGIARAKFWITKANGADANVLAEDTTVRAFSVVEDIAPRFALTETFASCFGGVSAIVAPLADSIARVNSARMINLRYQFNLGTSTDPLQNTFGLSRQGFYRNATTPLVIANGRSIPDLRAVNRTTFANEIVAQPAFCNITGTATRTGNRFNINYTVTPTATLPGSGVLAQVALAEKGVFHTSGTNGETIFNNVVRRAANSFPFATAGFVATVPVNVPVTTTFPTAQPTIPIKLDSIIAVIIIQDTASKLVLNAAVINVVNGVDDVLDASDIELYPNPAKNMATLSLEVLKAASVNIQLLNSIGQVVRTYTAFGGEKGQFSQDLDLKGLSPGIYNVNISAGGQQTHKRLVIE